MFRYGGSAGGTMSVASTLTRSRSEPPSNTNTIARSNAAFRDDRSDDRQGEIHHDPYLGNYPTNGTLPIQRPLYQQVSSYTIDLIYLIRSMSYTQLACKILLIFTIAIQ